MATSILQIDIPSGIILATSGVTCSIVSATNILSTASCTISGTTLTISSMFNDVSTYGYDFTTYTTPTISFIVAIVGSQNPYSVTNAGSFSIRSYNVISGTNRLVDTGTASSSFTPTASIFTTMTSVVSSTSTVTYSETGVYTFTFVPSKAFTSGSYLKITPPTEIGTSSTAPTCSQLSTLGVTTTFSSC